MPLGTKPRKIPTRPCAVAELKPKLPGAKPRVKMLATPEGSRSGILPDTPQGTENEKFFEPSPSSRKPLSPRLEPSQSKSADHPRSEAAIARKPGVSQGPGTEARYYCQAGYHWVIGQKNTGDIALHGRYALFDPIRAALPPVRLRTCALH